MALNFSYKNKLLSISDFHIIKKHIEKSKLPSNIKKYFSLKDLNKILKFMKTDKKNNSDEISLVLLKKIGNPIINQKYKMHSLSLFLKKQLMN